MQISIGQKIRELRLRSNRTQAETALALGVSPQAVSRWEMGVTYPDLELLPSLANYFGTSIDGLFGFQSEWEIRLNTVLREAGSEQDVDKRLTLLRSALIEFPGHEKIQYELAAALSEAGWRHLHEHLRYNDDGFLVHEIERHLENHYWTEAVKLFETVLAESKDPALLNDSAYSLTLLYCNLGEYEKGLALAERMAPLCYSRELLRSYAVDGAEKSRYEGASLLALAHEFANQMVYTLMNKKSNFQSDLPIRMLTKTIELLEGLFDGGTMGAFHAVVSELRLYLSEHQWRCGMRDEAFASLDEALAHAKAYDALLADETEHPYTSPLLENVPLERDRWVPGETAPTLADHWPIWLMPEYDDVAAEMTADPRWDEWVKRCGARDAEK